MTANERNTIRAAIDQARRSQLGNGRSRYVDLAGGDPWLALDMAVTHLAALRGATLSANRGNHNAQWRARYYRDHERAKAQARERKRRQRERRMAGEASWI